jgi:hypothetical protein
MQVIHAPTNGSTSRCTARHRRDRDALGHGRQPALPRSLRETHLDGWYLFGIALDVD